MLKIAWNSLYAHPLPVKHRFPMIKYDLIPEQLLYEGTISENNIFDPGFPQEADLRRVHHEDYLIKLEEGALSEAEIRRIGFPFTPQLIAREKSIMKGTIQCALYALDYGVALNVAGGTHHAYADRGEGFCLLNDIAIAAAFLLHNRLAKKILIIDLDVHQGNGTAAIFRHDPSVFTFSMHGEKNYPLIKERSDLDIALPDQCDDTLYIRKLDYHLNPKNS